MANLINNTTDPELFTRMRGRIGGKQPDGTFFCKICDLHVKFNNSWLAHLACENHQGKHRTQQFVRKTLWDLDRTVEVNLVSSGLISSITILKYLATIGQVEDFSYLAKKPGDTDYCYYYALFQSKEVAKSVAGEKEHKVTATGEMIKINLMESNLKVDWAQKRDHNYCNPTTNEPAATLVTPVVPLTSLDLTKVKIEKTYDEDKQDVDCKLYSSEQISNTDLHQNKIKPTNKRKQRIESGSGDVRLLKVERKDVTDVTDDDDGTEDDDTDDSDWGTTGILQMNTGYGNPSLRLNTPLFDHFASCFKGSKTMKFKKLSLLTLQIIMDFNYLFFKNCLGLVFEPREGQKYRSLSFAEIGQKGVFTLAERWDQITEEETRIKLNFHLRTNKTFHRSLCENWTNKGIKKLSKGQSLTELLGLLCGEDVDGIDLGSLKNTEFIPVTPENQFEIRGKLTGKTRSMVKKFAKGFRLSNLKLWVGPNSNAELNPKIRLIKQLYHKLGTSYIKKQVTQWLESCKDFSKLKMDKASRRRKHREDQNTRTQKRARNINSFPFQQNPFQQIPFQQNSFQQNPFQQNPFQQISFKQNQQQLDHYQHLGYGSSSDYGYQNQGMMQSHSLYSAAYQQQNQQLPYPREFISFGRPSGVGPSVGNNQDAYRMLPQTESHDLFSTPTCRF